MDLSRELPEAIRIPWEDKDGMQTLDYEQIPFGCRKCHEYGHLFRDYPMNSPKINPKKGADQPDQGFSKVPSQKRRSRKQENQKVQRK